MRKIWHSIGGWRGYYQPVPPEGWTLLTDCSVVNASGEQCRQMLKLWLHQHHVHYRTGYLEGSNIFSAHFYCVVKSDELNEATRDKLSNWYIEWATSTFSIMSGTSWDLDADAAQAALDGIGRELAEV